MISKSINLSRALIAYIAGLITGKVKGRWMPVSLGIELTNHCNLNCPECITGSGKMTRPKGFMPLGIFEKILSETGPYLYNVNLYFQGEPMMHPDFFVFLEKAANLHSVVSTNGQFLTPGNAEKLAGSGLRKIIVSLDGMDQSTYAAYRQSGDFLKTADGIRNLSDAISASGSALKPEIQFLVNRHNESQIGEVRKFASEVKARLRLKSMQVLDPARAEEWMPEKESYKRYRKKKEVFVPKNRLGNHCLRLWLNPVVTWDGKVIPCCFDKNADHVFGDLNHQSFREIWYGDKATKFRQSLLDRRSEIGICRNCTTGLSGVRY